MPGCITALVLVTVVAVWAFVVGVMEAGSAFRGGEMARNRAFIGLTGLISVALGVALASRPDTGATLRTRYFWVRAATVHRRVGSKGAKSAGGGTQ